MNVAYQPHGIRPIGTVIPIGCKSYFLCMKSKVHLKDVSPTKMEQTT